MPVILLPADHKLWLDPAMTEGSKIQPMLQPFPAEEMIAYPVGTEVNNPRYDGPGCIERVA